MEHAQTLLQDALHVITAANAVTNPPLKDTLARAALSAAEHAVAELRRHLQPNPVPTSPLLDITPIEPHEDTEEGYELLEPADISHPQPPPRPYQDFVAAMVPVLRANYTDTQQVHIARIGQLWQKYKNSSTLAAAIAAATEEVQAGRERSLSSESSI